MIKINSIAKLAFLDEFKRLGRAAKEDPKELSNKLIIGTGAGMLAGMVPFMALGAKRGNKAATKFIENYFLPNATEETLRRAASPIFMKEVNALKNKTMTGAMIGGTTGTYLGSKDYFKKRGIKINLLSPFIKAKYTEEAKKKYY